MSTTSNMYPFYSILSLMILQTSSLFVNKTTFEDFAQNTINGGYLMNFVDLENLEFGSDIQITEKVEVSFY